MNYDEFKSELLNFWVDNHEYRDFEITILEKGYNFENAKKDNFSLTKGVDAFNEWLLGTNLKFFNISSLNYNNSIKKLTEGIYEKFKDMALTLYFDLGGYAKNAMVLSAMVPDDHLKEWGESKEDVIYYGEKK